MSLYGDYIKERQGDHILEVDEGFATYRFVDAHTVYIVDIYVKPEARKFGHAARLADTIANIAREHGCKYMLGSVATDARGATDSLKVLLAYGMKLHQTHAGGLLMRKEI